MLCAFTPVNLRRLCRSRHRYKTRQDRVERFLAPCSLDWRSAGSPFRNHRTWAQMFMMHCNPEPVLVETDGQRLSYARATSVRAKSSPLKRRDSPLTSASA